MDVKEILSINVENLAKRQHEAVKNHALNILEIVSTLIKTEQYSKIHDLCQFSPAGDGMGDDNNYIDFGIKGIGNELETMDICQLCELLQKLKNSAAPSLKNMVEDDNPF